MSEEIYFCEEQDLRAKNKEYKNVLIDLFRLANLPIKFNSENYNNLINYFKNDRV